MLKNFPPEKRVFYEIMWKNVVQTDRQTTDSNIMRHMRFVCWPTNATCIVHFCSAATIVNTNAYQ
jgi:hypothetical protein